MMANNDIIGTGTKNPLLLVLQQHGDGIHPISLELTAATRRLSEQGGLRIAGVLITGVLTIKARAELCGSGLEEVYIYEDPNYYPFIAEYHRAALVHCTGILRPEILLIGTTPEGRILAPMAAIPLNFGVTAGCTELCMEKGLQAQTRSAFGGGIMARIITPVARPQIAMVRYGIFRDKENSTTSGATASRLINAACPLPLSSIRALVTEETPAEERKADAILVLGGGIRAKEDIERFSVFCASHSLELMCSRSLVE
jgi:electron transfer flavoprotein alpha subunit